MSEAGSETATGGSPDVAGMRVGDASETYINRKRKEERLNWQAFLGFFCHKIGFG